MIIINKFVILKVLLELKNGGYEVFFLCKILGLFLMIFIEVSKVEWEVKLDLMCSRVLYVYFFDEKDFFFKLLKFWKRRINKKLGFFRKGWLEYKL